MGRKGIHFLKTKSKSEAERIWHEALRLAPLGAESIEKIAQLVGQKLEKELVPSGS